jgi:hypothetical protein
MFWRRAEGVKVMNCESIDVNGDGAINVADRVYKERYTRVRIQDVLDGTSKTIAVGEAAYFFEFDDFPMWAGTALDDGSILHKTQDPINCFLGGPRSFPLSDQDLQKLPDGPDGNNDDCAYSWHHGGAFFGFVDGSVHFLTDNIDLRTFALLGDRLDGEVIRGLD